MTKQHLNELSFTEEDPNVQERLINCVKQNQYEAVKEFVENGAKFCDKQTLDSLGSLTHFFYLRV